MGDILDETARLLDLHTLEDMNILEAMVGGEPVPASAEELLPTCIRLIYGLRAAARFHAEKLEELNATGGLR